MDDLALTLIEAGGDLDRLTVAVEENCPIPTTLVDDISTVKRMWKLGEAAREYALALVARISIEGIYEKETKTIGICPACHKVYDDIETFPPPRRCTGSMEPCGFNFDAYPMETRKVPRYNTFEELESELIEAGVASHGTIYNRIRSYRRLVNGLGFSWEDAYRSVRASPYFIENALELARWDRKTGQMVDVSDTALISDGADGRHEKIAKATPAIRQIIENGVGVIEEHGSSIIKSDQIAEVRQLSGKPQVDVYYANPVARQLALPLVISTPVVGSLGTVQEVYEIKLFKNGQEVSEIDETTLEAIYETLRAKNPDTLKRKELWKM